MLFSSNIFLFCFFPITLFIYYIVLKTRSTRNGFLVLASLFFYAWGEPRVVFIMIFSIIMNWAFALFVSDRQCAQKKCRWIMGIMVTGNLLILFIFKYLNFTIANLNRLNLGIPQTRIALPIGISFFTFQAMSYVIDVYRGNGKVQHNPLNVALYIAFFPQLIAGPIVRYETISDQIDNRVENLNAFCFGVNRFIIGLVKKVLLANTLAIVADKAFSISTFGELSVSFAWLGAIAYTFQIFYDFSGYSDMAIGLGQMFGFQFLENFNYPYISRSISEFWRRWHISLGTWFRDYVYIPLGGSRVSKTRLIFNLFVVWFLTGIWHGASWNFIIWGLFYFCLLTFEKLTKIPERLNFTWQRVLYQGFTILCVIGGWVLFRAAGLKHALKYCLAMFGLSENVLFDDITILYLHENMFFLLFALLFSFPVIAVLRNKLYRTKMIICVKNFCYPVIMFGLFYICVSYLVKGTYNPFIYFNF